LGSLGDSVKYLKGVGGVRAALFEKLGVTTVWDLLTFFPRGYEDRSIIKRICDIIPGEACSVRAFLLTAPVVNRIRKGMELLKFRIGDGSGYCDVTYFNQIYLKEKFVKGKEYLFYGKFERNFLSYSVNNPDFEEITADSQTKGRIVPIYPLVKGLNRKSILKIMSNALEQYVEQIEETLPDRIIQKYNLIDKKDAIKKIHNPNSFEDIEKSNNRLIFEEFLILQLGLSRLKYENKRKKGFLCNKSIDISEFYNSLPFELTRAQKRAIDECISDFKTGRLMNRLLQGDVGSGKTLVAEAAAYYIIKNGGQAAFMVPTAILASQHFENISRVFTPLGIKTEILTGNCPKSQRKKILNDLINRDIDIIVGTHSLLEDDVVFKNLGLIICDEQHRFGVAQRSKLTLKGENPHLLVMSATPIPRTLALIIYGDLDISVLDELPPGRQPVITHLVNENKRDAINKFIDKKLSQGQQGYIVCPLVYDSDNVENLADVINYTDNLRSKFKNARIDLIHGKMKAADKDRIMTEFNEGKIDILVSTTVIEVGVDVKNATFIIIENAERYGLSQLHQLRGRVGRSEKKSYCIMVSNSQNYDTLKRLKVICDTTDGFVIAQKDLEMRGPGEFFGRNQHGLPKLKKADIAADTRVLKLAQNAAREILEVDPNLSLEENRLLKKQVYELFNENKGNFLN